MDQQGSHELVIRCKQGVFLSDFKAKQDIEMRQLSADPNCAMHVLADVLVLQEKKRLVVHDYTKVVNSVEYGNLVSSQLSNQNKFVVTLEKQEAYLLNLLRFPQLTQVRQFPVKLYKREFWPFLKFSEDDSLCFTIQASQLVCLETTNFQTVYEIGVGPCEYFSVQPFPRPMVICYSLQDFNSKESHFKIIDANGKERLTKKFQKTSEMEIIWSPSGEQVLVQKGYHEDSTGQSYFGQNQVLQYDFQKNSLKELPTYEGPVHHVCWSPKSNGYVLLSGFMPSGAVFYDPHGKPRFEFGKDHKNKLIWSKQRFLMICGFGNLDGSIHVWDTETLKLVSQSKYKSASLCHWSPCGRFYLCAKVTPRMNVDNQYSVFDYYGTEVVNRKFNELYDVQFRPSTKVFAERGASPERKPKAAEIKKPFQAFGDSQMTLQMLAQQQPQHQQQQGVRQLQGNEKFGKVEQNFPPGYIPPPEKKKRQRNRKPKQQQGGQDEEDQ